MRCIGSDVTIIKGERIVEFLLHVLENEESEEAQAVVCVGISKLMLSGMITDERVRLLLMLTLWVKCVYEFLTLCTGS